MANAEDAPNHALSVQAKLLFALAAKPTTTCTTTHVFLSALKTTKFPKVETAKKCTKKSAVLGAIN